MVSSRFSLAQDMDKNSALCTIPYLDAPAFLVRGQKYFFSFQIEGLNAYTYAHHG